MIKTFKQTASRMLIWSAVISTPIGLLGMVYPPAVENTIWNYPYHSGTHVVVSIVLVIAHLLKAYGFVGLSRIDEDSQLIRWSLLIAALGFVIVAVCEGISATLVGVSIDSPVAINLNNGYGAGSMLLAIPSMIGGIPIIKRGLLDGFSKWSVFLSGAFMVFVVTPALFMGRDWPAFLALTGWSLFYVWIGMALGRKVGS